MDIYEMEEAAEREMAVISKENDRLVDVCAEKDAEIARLKAKLHRVEQWVIDDMLADQKRRIIEAVNGLGTDLHLAYSGKAAVLAAIDKACEAE